MSTRTSPEQVQSILGEHYDGSMDLNTFIVTASTLVDWLQSSDSDGLLNTGLRERIETHLAAHFYEHADQITQSRSTGRATGSFQGVLGSGLNSTKYGRTAMLLDITNRLAKREKEIETGMKYSAGATWLGSENENSPELYH